MARAPPPSSLCTVAHHRAPSKLERWDPRAVELGVPKPRLGLCAVPYTSASALLPGDPPWGTPLQGDTPCTLTLLMMWGPAQGPRRLVEVHWDPRWEGSGGDGVTGRTDGQSPPSAMCASLTKNTKTGGGGRGPYPNPSSAAPTWGPILDGPLWEGMLGVLRSLNLQRPLLPGHPSWPHHTWHCHVPSLRRPWAITPAEPPGPGPTHLPPSLGHL